jgi:hypothetical protein
MAGTGAGDQTVLVRADLLLGPTSQERTSLQIEYLPSGDTCRGTVDRVRSQGFDGHCTMTDGSQRAIHAQWTLASGAGDLRGMVTSRPL